MAYIFSYHHHIIPTYPNCFITLIKNYIRVSFHIVFSFLFKRLIHLTIWKLNTTYHNLIFGVGFFVLAFRVKACYPPLWIFRMPVEKSSILFDISPNSYFTVKICFSVFAFVYDHIRHSYIVYIFRIN